MKKKTNSLGYKIFRPFFYIFMKLYYNPKIYGKENISKKGALIIASNHTKGVDPWVIGMSTPRAVHFLAKKELHDGKFGFIFRFLGTVPVDRKSKDENAKEKSLELLRLGEVYAIFPEGTINRKKEDILLPFKFGAVSFASKTDTPIIPAAIYGTYKFRSKNLSIMFGRPFKVGNMTLEKANERLRKEVEKLYLKQEKLDKERKKINE